MPVVFEAEKKEKEKRGRGRKKGFLKRTMDGVLADFLVRPKRVNFETQEEKEEVILLLRQHWVTNLFWIFLCLLMIVFPLVFWGLGLKGAIDFLPGRFLLAGAMFWYVLVYSFFLVKFLSWYFNVYIVTDERVVDVDFYNLLYKQVSSTRIAKIQDVTYRVTGAFASFFNYGDVYIQTAGAEINFEFMRVPKPAVVARTIAEMMEKEEGEWQPREG